MPRGRLTSSPASRPVSPGRSTPSTSSATAASGFRPLQYLQASYFEQWLDSACQILVEKGV